MRRTIYIAVCVFLLPRIARCVDEMCVHYALYKMHCVCRAAKNSLYILERRDPVEISVYLSIQMSGTMLLFLLLQQIEQP